MTDRGARRDVVVIGSGHNGLVCAAYLARAGLRTLVLERRDRIGGSLGNAELAPGVSVPAYAHTVGRLWPLVARELRLGAHGVRFVQPAVRVLAPDPDGPAVTLWGDPQRTAGDLVRRDPALGRSYLALDEQIRSLGRVVARLMGMTPPDPGRPDLEAAIDGLRLGLDLRGLGERDARALFRVLPMPVADYLSDRLGDDALRAAIAYRGLLHSSLGPRSAGSTQVLLTDGAATGGGAAGQTVYVRGGPAVLADGLAAAAGEQGAEIRTGAHVVAITQRDGRATGVALEGGEELDAGVVVSGVDPKRTLLGLVDPEALGPYLGWRVGNLRQGGTLAKVDLGLRDLPRWPGTDGPDDVRLRGRIVIAPTMEWLDRAVDAAKYGRISDRPLLEATIPSLVDDGLVDRRRAGSIRHVMSVLVQSAPYHLRDGDWAGAGTRDALADRVIDTLDLVAPGIGDLVEAQRVVTPLDLERDLGMTEGHPFHGEPALDQWFAWRPLLGSARYRMPLDGLYLCGPGAHPGGGITGLPGRNAARAVLRDLRRRRR